MNDKGTEHTCAKLEQAAAELVYPYRNRHGLTMLIYIYIYINSQRFKHNFTPDMLFHLESLEKKQIANMRETKLDHRNYHDFDK